MGFPLVAASGDSSHLRCAGFLSLQITGSRDVARALGMWASAVAALRPQSTGSVVVVQGAKLLRGMWDLPRSGIEAMSSASAGGFFTTEPTGIVLLKKRFANLERSPRQNFNLG